MLCLRFPLKQTFLVGNPLPRSAIKQPHVTWNLTRPPHLRNRDTLCLLKMKSPLFRFTFTDRTHYRQSRELMTDRKVNRVCGRVQQVVPSYSIIPPFEC